MAAIETAQSSAAEPAKAAERRILHFGSIDDCLDEANRLAASHRRGVCQQLGNWTLGQVFGHLATWAEFAYSPCPIKAPWIVRFVMGFQRKKFIYGPMKPGIRIPRVDAGTLGTGPMEMEEGLVRFRAAFERLKRQTPTHPSPVFGLMSKVEAQEMNLRHAELHLGFFLPG
ncbi:MAG TPA: DUF1569 domain-containing protein [Tepidisphaeraceae bacterium]|nr:DUF1569 domain-containing protein [Tepidisphaeraceae bacterium]